MTDVDIERRKELERFRTFIVKLLHKIPDDNSGSKEIEWMQKDNESLMKVVETLNELIQKYLKN